MATKRVCDRCGAEINPYNSVTYAGMRQIKNDINDNDYELCVSCAHELRKWFSAPRKEAEEALKEGMKPADYMRICFAMLDSADVVLFQHGWQESKGAKLEYDYAKYIGKKNIIFNDSLDNYKDNVKIVAVMMRWMMDED